MKRIQTLPAAFKRFEAMAGALDFAVFENASGRKDEILSVVPQVLGSAFPVDLEKLRSLEGRRLTERAFFGDWYDCESGMLLRLGEYTTDTGSALRNPKLKTLDDLKIVSGSSPLPEAGAGGQFAYAFSWTPYRLQGKPGEVQAVFEEIRDFILPPFQDSEILDWSSPRLPEVSDYFEAGMEWWGVFLFSLYIPSLQRLTLIAGSTTD